LFATKKILIAPLDWGMGHTSRCVPIIRYLLEQQCHVYFVGTEAQQSYIKEIGLDVSCFTISPSKIHYGKTTLSTYFSLAQIAWSWPKRIIEEQKWLNEFLDSHIIDGIISDNRYGFYRAQIPSVIITHQLSLDTGLGNWTKPFTNMPLCKWLHRFHQVWIPDTNQHTLSGALSYNPQIKNSLYIGWLSQFVGLDEHTQHNHSYDVSCLFSGPEPQRTLLSDKCWAIAQALPKYRFNIIEGTNASMPVTTNNTTITSNALIMGSKLAFMLHASKKLLLRGGYSSLMDALYLNKHSLIIPTPGQ
jgi:predicted glycosyltransferase